MKKFISLSLFLVAASATADGDKWTGTSLSDETIKKIQEASYQYKSCVSAEMQKPVYQKQESRQATEVIVKQCEPILTKMREVYEAAKVPGVVADRHLKQKRLQTTREVLQDMMMQEAQRSMENQPK